ncbi:MAG TPA: lysophospholipid acyltransferase family protein [Steroidobacteraceae bacterium]|nr:lysophospholipid acyltransferase family protein [Steroidobacteraceae bacterium]
MVTQRTEDLPGEEAERDDAHAPPPTATARRPVRRGSRSKRRLTWGRRLAYRIAVPLGMLIIRFFWATCRIVRVEGMAHVEKHLLGGQPAVVCYWHRHQLLCWSYLVRLVDRGLRTGWLISASVDGEAISEIARRMGGGGPVFRGSTTSKGAEALRAIYKAVTRDGVSPGITPDGPYGPRSVFKPGVVKIAQLSGAPLLPMSWCANHAWVLKTWDRFVVPRPFCRVVVAVGDAITVPRETDEAGTTEVAERMERTLEDLFQQARTALEKT